VISLVPAFGTLYQCLTPLESTRFLSAQKLKRHEHTNEAGDHIDELKKAQKSEDAKMGSIPKGAKNEIDNKATASDSASDNTSEVDEATAPLEVSVKKKAHFSGMLCLLASES